MVKKIDKVPVSPHVQHLREKLKDNLEEQDKEIKAESLAHAKTEIFLRLTRNLDERIPVKNLRGKITFDENQHPASPQIPFVKQTLRKLQEETPSLDLKGRISSSEKT